MQASLNEYPEFYAEKIFVRARFHLVIYNKAEQILKNHERFALWRYNKAFI